jgi:arylsulfatase A-like enzyme
LPLLLTVLGAQAGATPVPQLVARVDINGTIDPTDVVSAAGTNRLYVATKDNPGGTPPNPEFYIFDVSSPATPRLLGSLNVGATVNKIAYQGQYAYLATAADAQELVVVDLSNPSAPVKVGSYDAPGNADGLSVAVVGTTAYLGTANNGAPGGYEFYALNVATPTAVTRRGAYKAGTDVNDIAVNGTDAYLATSRDSDELYVLNVANPAAIAVRRTYNAPGTADATGIAYASGKLYLVTRHLSGINRPDFFILSAASVSLLGSVSLDSENTSIAVFRDRAYVTTMLGAKALTIVDVTNPAQPAQIAAFAAGAGATAVAVNGDRTYLTTTADTQELQVLDTTSLLRPNVIVVMTDDQRYDVLQYMPILQQKLVERGVTFTNAFVPTSECCPSRSSFLTGEYAHNSGVLTNEPPIGGAPAFVGRDTSTIATWLKGIGYRTGLYGKYLNAYDLLCPPHTAACYVPPGWDEWHAFVNVPQSYNYKLVENGTIVSYGAGAVDYATDVLTSKAIQFIQGANGRPFFLLLTTNVPHAELPSGISVPPPRHAGAYVNVTFFHPPSYDEADLSDKPVALQNGPRANDPLGIFTYESWTRAARQRGLESLLAVDDAIADIDAALDATHQTADTIVVFFSDNGLMNGEHRIWGVKECAYEECIRVPMIVRYPRLNVAPRWEGRIAMNFDLAATFAELADVSPSSPINGMSLVPVLRQQPVNWRTDFLIEWWRGPAPVPTYTAVRTESWKYIEHQNGERELYDLEADPYELQSLHADPAYDAIKASLKQRLEELEAE